METEVGFLKYFQPGNIISVQFVGKIYLDFYQVPVYFSFYWLNATKSLK